MIRPCRHTLAPALRDEWIGHLCGLCLALRDGHGQLARVATNYDGLLISVLVRAQLGGAGTRVAGPCPLRGMRTATVATGEGARLAAVVSLMLASATLADHAVDGDGALARRSLARAATGLAQRWTRHARAGAAELGLDAAVLLDAVARQPAAERSPATLLSVTEPTETATGAAFAHTAVLAARPANIAPLTEAGRLFGRLAHLLDAVEDLAADTRTGAWNPLVATDTDLATARRHADDAVLGVRLALADVTWASRGSGKLAHRLLVHELDRAVQHAFAHADPKPIEMDPHAPRGRPRGLVHGCGVALALFCTCQVCCTEFEGPWSGKRREGWCTNMDCCDCGCEGCDGCSDCCECCNCCDCSA